MLAADGGRNSFYQLSLEGSKQCYIGEFLEHGETSYHSISIVDLLYSWSAKFRSDRKETE